MAKKISNEQVELLLERITNYIDKANTYYLTELGKKLSKIKKLPPRQAQELIQMFKFNGNIDEIIDKIAEYLGLSIKDIDAICNEYARIDQQYYKPFYEYRGLPFVEYAENKILQNQTRAIANMIKEDLYSFTRNNVLGYSIRDEFGNIQFNGLRETYNRVLDEAFLNISQGEQTFDIAMSQILKDVGGSGLKTIDYASGRSVRLDSVVRMHLMDGLRTLHNENQKIMGDEFKYNGVEVTHHLNAAPDHIDTVDGKQFALVDKIQEQINDGTEKQIKQSDIRGNQVWVKGKMYDDFNAVNNSLQRQVSTLNCRHTIFSIILGVSKPEYTQEQLDTDKEKNLQGFMLDGKHYTNYEGEQLQRQLERKIRQQKDIQILAKESNNMELVEKSQQKITEYTNKYKELNDVSGLKPRVDRLKVSGYKRIKVEATNNFDKPLDNIEAIAKYVDSRKKELYGLNEKENQLKLNDSYGFNNKPTLIDENIFDNLDDNFNYNNPEEMKQNQYVKLYRGWDKKEHYENYINIDSKNFKYGEGGDADGVGTYATDNEWTASQFSHENEDLLMEIAIPYNTKFISKEKLLDMHYNIYNEFNQNRSLYEKKYGSKVVSILDTMNNNISSTAVLNGYEVIYNNQWQNWIILNRSKAVIKERK